MDIHTSSRTTGQQGRRGLRLATALVPVCLLALSGCRVVQETARLPVKTVNAVVPRTQSAQPDPGMLQAALLRYADDYFSRTSTGLDEYARRANTPEARNQALEWKIAIDTSVIGIATGPNPVASLVDFVSLSSITRAFLEVRAREVQPPGAFDAWMEDCRVLETNAWILTQGVLSGAQVQELRSVLTAWLEANKETQKAFLNRPQEVALDIRRNMEQEKQPGSLFGLIGLDPMASLDPAVREMTRTRLFAERALYAAERMPYLLRWQTELLTLQLLEREQVSNAFQSAERLSRAAESASQTAALLPERLSAERKAIVDALETQQGQLRALSQDVTRTLNAGEQMSTSLNTAIISFDALMKRFGVGEPDTSPPDTNSPPFNILDYARTAQQVAAMAEQLDSLIKSASTTVDAPALDKRIAQLNDLSGKARGDAKSVLNHAFLLLAGLVLLVFVCAWLYRRFAPAPRISPALLLEKR